MANLLPVFGRDTGTSHPGCFTFLTDRGVAPLTFYPLNSQGRSRNAHLNMFGPPGICNQAVSINDKNKLPQEPAAPASLLAQQVPFRKT